MSIFDSAEMVARYEDWFTKNGAVFESEIAAIRRLLPAGVGFEVGIGTGLFAREIGICMGNDPSAAMLALARERGLRVCTCTGDRLPFHDGCFDFTLMVTVICFLNDPMTVLRECRRVVKPDGSVVIGFVDSESPLGKLYRNKSDRSIFYRKAALYSPDKVKDLLIDTGFEPDGTYQTLFGPLDDINDKQIPREGSGQGSFVAVRGMRRNRGEMP